MKYYVGIDLHSNNSYIAIIDELGNIRFKQRVKNDITIILKTLEIFEKEIIGIVIESTFNWYWLVDGLEVVGYKIYLANPIAIQQYSGLKHTNDKTDAIWLAEMLRLGILPTGYIYPKEKRSIRDLLRKRTLLMQHRTALMISLKGFIHNWTGKQISRTKIKQFSEIDFNGLFENQNNLDSTKHLNDVIEIMNNKIKAIETTIFQKIELEVEYKKLLTVWGIGKFLAAIIVLETGNINRFANAGHYASYCRCVSSKKISNDKKKGSGNKKNGNKYLAWAYIEAAYFMKRFYPKAQKWFDRKSSKRGLTVATKALSNKIARASYFIMRDQTVFDPQRIFA